MTAVKQVPASFEVLASIFNFLWFLLLDSHHIGGAIMVGLIHEIGFIPPFAPLHAVVAGIVDVLDSVTTYFFFVYNGGRSRELLQPETAEIFPFDGMVVCLFFRSIYNLDFGFAEMITYSGAVFNHIYELWGALINSSLISLTLDLLFVIFIDLIAVSFLDVYYVVYYLYGIELWSNPRTPSDLLDTIGKCSVVWLVDVLFTFELLYRDLFVSSSFPEYLKP